MIKILVDIIKAVLIAFIALILIGCDKDMYELTKPVTPEMLIENTWLWGIDYKVGFDWVDQDWNWYELRVNNQETVIYWVYPTKRGVEFKSHIKKSK